MKSPQIIAEGSSIFSQLRVVMLYGSSKPPSTSLKPTNERHECQRCWQEGKPLHTGLSPHRGQADPPLAANRVSKVLVPLPRLVHSAAPKGGSCGGMNPDRGDESVGRNRLALHRRAQALCPHRSRRWGATP